jgi:2,5-diamino-6-(ribosylamino)-4(3H)-pyrimidinone 5'-phosphate reductase
MNRPKILINVAMSVDGKIDTVSRKGMVISSEADKARVDRLRAGMDAILVGGRTLLEEDPKLTIKSSLLRSERKENGLDENPAKIGIVSKANLKLDGDFVTAGSARRMIYTTERTTPEQIHELEKAGVEVFVTGSDHVDLVRVMQSLYELGLEKVLVEGGGSIIAEFFRLDMVDEMTMYIAPVVFGGSSAPTLVDGPGFIDGQLPILRLETVDEFDDDGGIFLHYIVDHSLSD